MNEAEGLYVECLDGRLEVLGEDHPYTLEALGGLAQTLLAMGRLDEAETFALDSHRGRSARFGADHSLTTDAAQLLDEIYEASGRSKTVAEVKKRIGEE